MCGIIGYVGTRDVVPVLIGGLKKLLAMEIYQPAREEAVLRHVRQVNPGPLDADAIARLFERIIDEARRLERVMQEQETQPPGAEPDPDSTAGDSRDSDRK